MGKSIQGAFSAFQQTISPGNDGIEDAVIPIFGELRARVFNAGDGYPDGSVTEGHIVDFTGTIRKPRVKMIYNERLGVASVVFRKNGVPQDCRVLIPPQASNGSIITGTGTFTFSPGDYLDALLTIPAQSPSDEGYQGTYFGILGVYFEMDTPTTHHGVYRAGPPSDGSVETDGLQSIYVRTRSAEDHTDRGWNFFPMPLMQADNIPNASVANVTHLVGGNAYALVTDEAILRGYVVAKCRAPGTFTGVQGVVNNSAAVGDHDATTTVKMLVNGSDAGDGAAFNKGFNGRFGPSSGSGATVSGGDLICYGIRPSDPGNLADIDCRVSSVSVNFQSNNGHLDIHSYPSDWFQGINPTTGVPNPRYYSGVSYASIFGEDAYGSLYLDDPKWIETDVPSCTHLFKLRAYCAAYSGDPVVITLCLDGSATALSLTINGTGWFEDDTHSVYVAPGCRVCYSRVVADGDTFVGNITVLSITQEASNLCQPCTVNAFVS